MTPGSVRLGERGAGHRHGRQIRLMRNRVERRGLAAAKTVGDVDDFAGERQIELAQQPRADHRIARRFGGGDQRRHDDIARAPQQQPRRWHMKPIGQPRHGFGRVVRHRRAVFREVEGERIETITHGQRGGIDQQRSRGALSERGLVDPGGREDDDIGGYGLSSK